MPDITTIKVVTTSQVVAINVTLPTPIVTTIQVGRLPAAPKPITTGDLTDDGTDGIVITGGTDAVVGAGTSLAQHVADSTHNGYLSSTDWGTFNGKSDVNAFTDLSDVPASYTGEGSKIVSVKATEDGLEFTSPAGSFTPADLTDTGTDGITITGGTDAVNGSGTSISQQVADATHNGYLSATDWGTFNSKLPSPVTEADISLSDVTTDDVSTTAHGFQPKLPDDPTLFLNGQGDYVVVPGTNPNGSGLISGGGVAWTGTNFDYIIAAADYLINGSEYTSAQTAVTLDPADPSDDRIDVFYVDDAGLAGVITGTPATNPVAPSVDPATQLYLTFAYVPAGSSEPAITNENIYLENTEWTTSTNSAGTIDLASTNNPYAGSTDIEGTSVITGNLFTAVKPSGTLQLSDYASLIFFIRSKAAWPASKGISMFWLSGSTPIGVTVTLKNGTRGFDSSNTTDYQLIVVPTSLFNAGSADVNTIQFQITGGGGAIGWYIDNIILQPGQIGGNTGGDFSTNTNVSVVDEIVLFADTTGKLGKRSTGTGIAKLTAGVLGTSGAFTDLSDVPSDYTGEGSKIVSVKATEDGLEFVDASSGGMSRTVTPIADGTSITPQTPSDSNVNIQVNTQTAGTLTVNAPSATAEARTLLLRVKATNTQTFSWNSIYRAPSLLPLPTAAASGKTIYVGFIYNDTDSKWDLTAVMNDF